MMKAAAGWAARHAVVAVDPHERQQLVPVANKPVLFLRHRAMAEAGMKDRYRGRRYAQEIRNAVGDGSRWNVDVTYIPKTSHAGWRACGGDQPAVPRRNAIRDVSAITCSKVTAAVRRSI